MNGVEQKSNIVYRDLGTMAYGDCWKLQQSLFEEVLHHKGASDAPVGYLLTVEHPPVYTLGRSAHEENLVAGEAFLRSRGAEVYRIDRGGDVTFHGEGQAVVYPIVDLERIGIGIKAYIDRLEQAVIDTVAAWGICGERVGGATGVWIDRGTARERKICAIGVRASHFVTMHGLALNVNTDLKWFSWINPCGFIDKGVTSVERETGRKADMKEVKDLLVKNLTEKLNVKIYK